MNCACGSNKDFSICCKPFIEGTDLPKSPEDLMRSRYVAHVLKDIEYIRETTAPEKRSFFNEDRVREWVHSEWLGLKVLRSEGKIVEFMAKYKSNNETFSHHEVSKFRQIGERWYYLSGESHIHQDGVEDNHHLHHAEASHPFTNISDPKPKTERNSPCPCGSGKKYKKCCELT